MFDTMKSMLCLLIVYGTVCFAYAVTQPVYQNAQYVGAQAVQYRPQQQYQQQQQSLYIQPQFIAAGQTARPVYEGDKGAGLQKYSTQIKQPIQQVLINTNVDRQIQRVAQTSGPYYLQQVQAAQQAGQAQEAISAAQRKATSQTLNRQIQPVPIPQQPQQTQYFREVPQTQIKYAQRPAAIVAPQAYRQLQQQRYQQQQQQQQQSEDEQPQNPEEYDPNPSYQFGFDVNDDLYTNYQNRKEQREGNKITGSYSVVDSDGFVRTVTYTADPKEGFKAEVRRQPTDIVVKIPKPDPQFAKQPQQYHQRVPAPQREQAQKQNVVYQYE